MYNGQVSGAKKCVLQTYEKRTTGTGKLAGRINCVFCIGATSKVQEGMLIGPFVESEQIWALSRKILLYGPERPFTAQVFIKIVDEQINSAIQPQIADSGAISQLLFLKRGRSGP